MAEFKRYTTIENIQSFGLPIGIIIMFDGSSWVDNSTIPGWYLCKSSPGHGDCPNFVWTFPRGGTTSTIGNTGGNNYVTLGANHIPEHCHNIDHEHNGEYYVNGGSHSHTYYYTSYIDPGVMYNTIFSTTCDNMWLQYSPNYWLRPTSNEDHNHSVSSTIANYIGNGDWNSNSYIYSYTSLITQTSFRVEPAYTTALFLRRCQ